jgi:hypothetical protein
MTVEITGVEITIGEQKLKLSLDEAKQLQEALSDVLGGPPNPPIWYEYPLTTTTPFPLGVEITYPNKESTYAEPMMIGVEPL